MAAEDGGRGDTVAAVRLVAAGPTPAPIKPVLIIAVLLIMAWAPLVSAAPITVQTDDFGIIEDLHEVLDAQAERQRLGVAERLATENLTEVSSQRRAADPGDPLGLLPDPEQAWPLAPTSPDPEPHPEGFELLTDPDRTPPEWPANLWSTLLNLNDYSVWISYRSTTGREHQAYEVAQLTGDLFQIPPGSATANSIDVDGDGDNDVRVGLTISFLDDSISCGPLDPFCIIANRGRTWDIDGDSLWIKPDIRFTVALLDEGDAMWDDFQELNVTLMKAFSYDTSLFTNGGESFIWVLEGRFTQPPEAWAFTIGLDRVSFDVSAGLGINALIELLTGVSSDATFAGIQAPYAITITNAAPVDCPDSWNPDDRELWFGSRADAHPCRQTAGFGYVHYAPDEGGVRPVLELAYIDATLTPGPGEDQLPRDLDLVLRNDNWLEDSLDSIELYAERPADLTMQYHENRTGVQEPGSTRPGNVTDSLVVLRDLPHGSFTNSQMDRIFCMLGNDPNDISFPGSTPTRLSMVLAMKNMTRDLTENSATCDMPIDPRSAPDTIVAFLATDRIASIDYTSWMRREGVDSDHMRVSAQLEDVPPALLVTGDFKLPAGGESRVIPNDAELDFLSQLLDTTMLTIVDVILDVGGVMNTIPLSLLDLSSSAGGGDMSLRVIDDLFLLSDDGEAGRVAIQLGSSAHPVSVSDHILLARDSALRTPPWQPGPVLPVALSVGFDGFRGLDLAYDEVTGVRDINISVSGGDPLAIEWVDHEGTDLANASFQSMVLSNLPPDMHIRSSDTSVEWRAASPIGSISYGARAGDQRNALVLEDLPSQLDLLVGQTVGFVANEPIGAISVQFSNGSESPTMDGDHFLFSTDEDDAIASLSGRISAVNRLAWSSPEVPGASDERGLGRVQLDTPGQTAFNVLLEDTSAHLDDPSAGLQVRLRLDPLPAGIDMNIPSNNSTGGLALPELTDEIGLVGIAGLLSDVISIGAGVNDLLANMTGSFAAGSTTDEDLSASISLNAASPFDLTVEAVRGRLIETPPPWVHGAALDVVEDDAGRGLHLRAWLPGLPPQASINYAYDNSTGDPTWAIDLEVEGWEPLLPIVEIQVGGIEDRSATFELDGLRVGEPLSLDVNLDLSSDIDRAVPRVSVDGSFAVRRSNGDPTALESAHVTFLDGRAKQRIEALVIGVPGAADMSATLGDVLEIDFVVPSDGVLATGTAAESIFLQMSREAVGRWWSSTVFMRDLPTELHLSTAPSTVFDITKPLSFQGTPQLDYTSTGDEMDLFIQSEGRSLDRRGDILLLAENLPARTAIAPTEDWGISIASSGDGIERLYLRMQDVPQQPGVYLRQVEVVGEELSSGTINVLENGGFYPIVIIDNVRGGSFIAIVNVDVEIGGLQIDGNAFMLDAQITGGVPTATTISMNGVAADLGLLNMLSGERTETMHIVAVEPISTAFATLITTLLG